MAATQRPVAEAAFSEPSGPPAAKALPSWAVVAAATGRPVRTLFGRWAGPPEPPSPRLRART